MNRGKGKGRKRERKKKKKETRGKKNLPKFNSVGNILENFRYQN